MRQSEQSIQSCKNITMFIDNIIKPTLIKDWYFCSSMINPFRREKIERMPEKSELDYIIATVVTVLV